MIGERHSRAEASDRFEIPPSGPPAEWQATSKAGPVDAASWQNPPQTLSVIVTCRMETKVVQKNQKTTGITPLKTVSSEPVDRFLSQQNQPVNRRDRVCDSL